MQIYWHLEADPTTYRTADTFVQVIDGEATIVIAGKMNLLKTGSSIVIPAHASSLIEPNGRFKMILTVIKSGYE